MEPVVGKIKDLAKSSQDFIDGLFTSRAKSSRRNPIEILKRLQRESFSDLMKLRDRQEKLERVVTFQKIAKGSAFQNSAGTHVWGEIDALGAILMMGSDVDQFGHHDSMNCGIRSKISFEAAIRENDALVAEFATGGSSGGDGLESTTLSLSKVVFVSNICDCVSATVMPVGAQFRHLGFTVDTSNQIKGLTELSAIGPPLMNEHNGSAIGLTLRKSNLIASLAHSLSGSRQSSLYNPSQHCFSTFGQIACQLPKGVKLSVSGVQKQAKSSPHLLNQGAIAIPVRILNQQQNAPHDPVTAQMETNQFEPTSAGSIAVKLESHFDENTRMEGWMQMNNSSTSSPIVQWGVSVIDDSEDELGWGLSVGGELDDGGSRSNRFRTESYLKFNVGRKFCIKPGVAYAEDGDSRMFGLMVRSNWSF